MSKGGKREYFFGLSLPIVMIGYSTRFLMDTNTRMFYPFTTYMAEGLGLGLEAMGWLLFLRSIVGVIGPLFGMISDRYGLRKMMMLALVGRGLSAAWLAFSHGWGTLLPMVIQGWGLAAFVPAMQAYFGEIAPREKLGRVMGMIEFSWASVALISLPVVGWAIQNYGWRAPLLGICVLQLLGALLVWRAMPPIRRRKEKEHMQWSGVGRLFKKRNVLASFFIAFLLYSSVSAFITLWGIWLALGFNLDAATIGLATTGIGVAELVGAGLASLFIDRIDKRFSSSLAMLALFFGYLLLPAVPGRFVIVFIMLMALSLVFELGICSIIPLFTEQETDARGTAMALIFSGIAIGTSVGPPLATILWEHSGVWGTSVICAVLVLIGAYLTRKYLSTSSIRRIGTISSAGK